MTSKFDLSHKWISQLAELQKYEKDIQISNFSSAVETKDIGKEFRILRKITYTNKHMELFYKDISEEIKEKNRYDHIIPFDHSILKCICQRKTGFENFFDEK